MTVKHEQLGLKESNEWLGMCALYIDKSYIFLFVMFEIICNVEMSIMLLSIML